MLPPECDPAEHTPAQQIAIQKKQIAELVEKYPDVFYIWNDGLDDTIMTAPEANAFIRSLRPGIIACSNWWDWKNKATRRGSQNCGAKPRREAPPCTAGVLDEPNRPTRQGAAGNFSQSERFATRFSAPEALPVR